LKISVFGRLLEIGANSVKEKSGPAGQDPMATHDESSFFFKSTSILSIYQCIFSQK
jgi:hypothetical protein